MTAWFKRTPPKPAAVVSPDPAGGTAPLSAETDSEFLDRMETELRPLCPCGKPSTLIVTMHHLDHCDAGPIAMFVCPDCIRDVHRFIDNTLEIVHRFQRWACKTCGGPVAAPHDLIEDVVKL